MNFTKTIVNAVMTWVNKRFKENTPDWNQNDSNADGYIKNRTHYAYEDEIVVLPNTSVVESSQGGLGFAFVGASTFEIKVGKEYKVTFDGETYSCVGYTDSSSMAGVVFLGNFTIIEAMAGTSGHTNTGEPFILMYVAAQGMAGIYTPTVDTHTIKISAIGEKVKKIDKKYLPDLPAMDYVSYEEYQDLTEDQMLMARENIGAGTSNFSGNYIDLKNKPTIYQYVVRYDTHQSLTDDDKSRARNNIGAVSKDQVLSVTEVQTLTDRQKELARANIGVSDFDGSFESLVDAPNVMTLDTEQNVPNRKVLNFGQNQYVDGSGCGLEINSCLWKDTNGEVNCKTILGHGSLEITCTNADGTSREMYLGHGKVSAGMDTIEFQRNSSVIGQTVRIINLLDPVDCHDAATKGYADNAIANLNEKIAPLNEGLNNKVDMVEGKGLSTEDYTTEEKDKLSRTVMSVNGEKPDAVGNVDIAIPEPDTVLDENGKLLTSVLPEGYPYAEVKETVLLPEQTLAFSDSEAISPAFNIEEGKTYIVNFDGKDYECICRVFKPIGIPFMGNGNIMFGIEDTGEPFLYTADYCWFTLSDEPEHTISVAEYAKTVNPIAQKFLPEGYPYKEILGEATLIEEMSRNFSSSRIYSLGFALELTKGETYIVTWDGVEYECTAVLKDDTYLYIGNPYYYLEYDDTGEPFFFMAGDENNALVALGNYDVERTTYTFSVKHLSQHIEKMDANLLPDGANIGAAGTGEYSEVFNNYTDNVASGAGSHAEGSHTTASGTYSHAEGWFTTASGMYSHAEGWGATASGDYSHAEGGGGATASGEFSHAEGSGIASGANSHAEGDGNSKASGNGSHAEGYSTVASGIYSHAEGWYTKAGSNYQHVQGKANVEDAVNTYAHIVGNGTSDSARSNAHTLDWDGNAWFAGDVYVGSTSGANKDDGSKKLVANGDKELVLTSSTEGSTKQFKITIDDDGVLTAAEIVV